MKLLENDFNYLSKLHDKVFIGDDFNEDNFEVFKENVLIYEQKGYNVKYFQRYIKIYEKELKWVR